jgi:hypothetical protein
MSGKPFVRVTAVTAVEICTRFNIKKEAWALLREGMAPGEFAGALMAGKQYLNGIDFMAHALPPREAVWWGCLCLQHACGNNLTPTDKAACRAAVQWVMESTQENGAAALAPAQAAGATSPAAGLAMAACQTGAIGAPPPAPPQGPTPYAAAKSVAGAIKMACSKADPLKLIETQRLFLELAIGMADGSFD